MKGNIPRITLLGSNSGRNVGDAAIMSAIAEVTSKEIPGIEIYVPSTNPKFIDENYGKEYNIKGIDVMPWTGSVRLFGLTTFWCLIKSDAALICDGIIFGKKLFNPLFNFLITLIFVAPFAKLVGCKMVCYSCGIGPFPSKASRLCAKWVLNLCDLVIMREHDSKKLAEEIGVTRPIEVTGDAAFINKVSSDERALEILSAESISKEKKLFGINITKYFDAWLEASERVDNKDRFLQSLSDAINAAKEKLGFDPVVFSTQPMDEEVAFKLATMISAKVITNSKYLSHDMQAVMRRCDLFMGMRFHSLILASAVESPIIGLIYAPKVRGYMRLLECKEQAVELASINTSNLTETIVNSWNNRAEIKAKQKKIVDELKIGAHRACLTLRDRYFPELRQAPMKSENIAANG